MKSQQEHKEEIHQFVDELFSNDQTPSDYFGISWQSLSALELEAPQIVCQSDDNEKTQQRQFG